MPAFELNRPVGLSATSGSGAVAAGHPAEVRAGLAMLAEGGNAFDAVVAAAFMGYVVEPAMCGIGGYGRLSAFHAASGELFRSTITSRAPAAARPDMFEIDETKPLKYYETPYTKGLRAEQGPLAVGVPGAVAGSTGPSASSGASPGRRCSGRPSRRPGRGSRSPGRCS